jgi:hypothetical protein
MAVGLFERAGSVIIEKLLIYAADIGATTREEITE